MNSRRISMLIVALLLLAAMAVVLVVFVQKAHEDFEDGITVSKDGVTEEVIKVRDLKLNPTDKTEYSINLTCLASGDFDIFFDFREKKDGGMKEFVDVTVSLGDKRIYEGSLSKLLENGEVVEFEGYLEAKKPVVVTICYEMPQHIGNEAQGTYSDFDINVKVVKK